MNAKKANSALQLSAFQKRGGGPLPDVHNPPPLPKRGERDAANSKRHAPPDAHYVRSNHMGVHTAEANQAEAV